MYMFGCKQFFERLLGLDVGVASARVEGEDGFENLGRQLVLHQRHAPAVLLAAATNIEQIVNTDR